MEDRGIVIRLRPPSWRLRRLCVSRGAAISCIPLPPRVGALFPLPAFSAFQPVHLHVVRSRRPPAALHTCCYSSSSSSSSSSTTFASSSKEKKKERKKIRERERSLARGWRAGGQWGEKQEKLHPFESHPRTPSGLKKSIKRREPAAVRGGRKRGREREREGPKKRGGESAKGTGRIDKG